MTDKITEIIGRVAHSRTRVVWDAHSALYSMDTTKPDYAWWDAMSRGEKQGFELASVFVRPAVNVRAAWTLGKGFKVRLAERHEYSDDLLQRWARSINSTLLTLFKDLDRLGDQYVLVNADGSLSLPSPNTVEMFYNKLDYRQAVRCVITSKFEDATLTDEYTADYRQVTVKNLKAEALETAFGRVEASGTLVMQYENLIGKLPVVHFTNERGVNETNGRSLFQGIRFTMSQYNDALKKALDAVGIMGNPIPTWEGMENLEETFLQNTVPTGVFDSNGEEIREVQLNRDGLNGLFIGKGGGFKFSAPQNGFTQDVRDMLKLLFLLVLEYLQIPETVWGGEMGQSRATSGEQMNTFYQSIEGRRLELEGVGSDSVLGLEAQGGLFALTDVWLRMRALVDPQVRLGDTVIEWDDIRSIDEALKFEKTQWAHAASILSDESALENLELVENAADEIDKARLEAEERQQADFEGAMQADLRLLRQDEARGQGADDAEGAL